MTVFQSVVSWHEFLPCPRQLPTLSFINYAWVYLACTRAIKIVDKSVHSFRYVTKQNLCIIDVRLRVACRSRANVSADEWQIVNGRKCGFSVSQNKFLPTEEAMIKHVEI